MPPHLRAFRPRLTAKEHPEGVSPGIRVAFEENAEEIHAPNRRMQVDPSTYASRFRLDLYEVKHIIRLFQTADKNASDGIDICEFRNVLGAIYDTKPENLQDAIVREAWERLMNDCAVSTITGEAQLDDFFHWYTQNLFNNAICSGTTRADETQRI
jgi:hypothetical protein